MSECLPNLSDHIIDQLNENIREITSDLVSELVSKWKSMYNLTEEEKFRRIQKLVEYIKNFYEEIAEGEEQKRIEMLNKIELKLQEFYKLQKDLCETDAFPLIEVKQPYSEFLQEIEKSMSSFVVEKNKRLERLKSMQAEEEILCKALGCSQLKPFLNSIPSEQQLDAFQLRLFELNEEKITRLKTYKDTRAIIIGLTKTLERELLTQFETDVHDKSEDVFEPTEDNMIRLETLKNSLTKQLEDTQRRREDLIEKLAKLWDRLKVEPEYKESFLAENFTIKKSHMLAIEKEIVRYEQLKRENMRQVIESTRDQIEVLWNKLTFSNEQRQEFRPFYTDHYSEDVLGLHELEIERLELYYIKNQHIFELAEKRNELWERMLHLDCIAQDKTRLFNNRGGQLLKEERERKALEVNLPKVDKKLKEALHEHGEPFYWHGADLLQKITQDWEERLLARESKKIARKVENQKVLESEALLGSRPVAIKRKGTGQPGVILSKTKRCGEMAADRTITIKTHVKTPRTPVALAKTPLSTSTCSIASYSQFHEGIERSASRSALKEVGNTPSIAHSSPTHATPIHATPHRRTPASSMRTPASSMRTPTSSKRTPRTVPRLAHCRKRLPIDI